MFGEDAGRMPPNAFASVALWVWRYYHERRRGIERAFSGRWADIDALLDDCVHAAMQSEHARLRAEMRALAKTSAGIYPVPVYD